MEKLTHVEEPEQEKPAPRRNWAMWGVIALLAVGNGIAVWEIGQTRGALEKLQQATQADLRELDERSQDLTTRADTHEVLLRNDLKDTQELAKSAASRASKQAEKRAEQMLTKLAAEHREQNMKMADELGLVKSATEQASGQLSLMYNDVGVVQNDVRQTRSDLDSTQAELTSVRGDLGVQSGLIATNAEQLAALRQMGERDYYEFTIPRDGKAYKVGNVAVKLRKTRPKQGKFTLNVIADDIEVEKKDRTINEPIQFYMSGARQPYEMVINEVQKDKIVGYLAAPKVLAAAR